jgi:Pyruvate/2-oxoacid:ferredoxin oxidoreductase gamma subunit
MRGGTANATVIVSEQPVGSPLVTHPTTRIARNEPSLDAFEKHVVPGGLIVANKTLIRQEPHRPDVRYCMIPGSEMARELGFYGAANVMLLTEYALLDGFPRIEVIKEIIAQALKKKDLVATSMRMVDAAVQLVSRLDRSLYSDCESYSRARQS